MEQDALPVRDVQRIEFADADTGLTELGLQVLEPGHDVAAHRLVPEKDSGNGDPFEICLQGGVHGPGQHGFVS